MPCLRDPDLVEESLTVDHLSLPQQLRVTQLLPSLSGRMVSRFAQLKIRTPPTNEELRIAISHLDCKIMTNSVCTLCSHTVDFSNITLFTVDSFKVDTHAALRSAQINPRTLWTLN
ncbi:unnamed protein product [Gordionus sp. m RMFG-2023]